MVDTHRNNISRGVEVSAKREQQLRNTPGGSNVGRYSGVNPSNMANTLDSAKSALAYAHNAKNPECIRQQVYKKYPSLDPDKR